jgi:hypothetical protein
MRTKFDIYVFIKDWFIQDSDHSIITEVTWMLNPLCLIINSSHKTNDRVTRAPLKTGGELRCSGRVASSSIRIAGGRAMV